MTDKLKACPFCGGTKIKNNHDDGQHWQTCQTCFADGPPYTKYREEGETEWNSRAPLPAVEAAEIEVVAYYSGEKFYASTEAASCDMAGPVRAVMYVDDHRRILAGVNQQAGSGVPEGFVLLPEEPRYKP